MSLEAYRLGEAAGLPVQALGRHVCGGQHTQAGVHQEEHEDLAHAGLGGVRQLKGLNLQSQHRRKQRWWSIAVDAPSVAVTCVPDAGKYSGKQYSGQTAKTRNITFSGNLGEAVSYVHLCNN